MSAGERQLIIDAYNLCFPHELSLSEEEKGDHETRYRRTLHRVRFTTFINTDYERASLDAALMTVPEGYEWAYLDKRAIVRLPVSLAHEFGEAATPALAITAAALRARASLIREG